MTEGTVWRVVAPIIVGLSVFLLAIAIGFWAGAIWLLTRLS